MKHWQLQEAKNKLSQLVRAVNEEPQAITVHGKEAAVLISLQKYRQLQQKQTGSLAEFFAQSPLADVDEDLVIERSKETIRDIHL